MISLVLTSVVNPPLEGLKCLLLAVGEKDCGTIVFIEVTRLTRKDDCFEPEWVRTTL